VTAAAGTFVYDGDCGFCTRFARWLTPRVAGRVEVVTAPRADLDVDVRTTSWFVTPAGTRLGRHAGIAAALDAAGGPWRLAGRAIASRPVAPLAGAVYDWVARNRHRMPGGTSECRLDEEH
jgi:predicted DCC family thiol-disulfide oxidoreductase YuxK